MKIKQDVYINRPDEFLKGNFNSLIISTDGDLREILPHYTLVGETVLDIDVDTKTLVDTTVAAFDAEIKKERAEHNVKMDLLQGKINEVLAIEHQAA